MAEDRLDRVEAILESLAKRDESLSQELAQTKREQAERWTKWEESWAKRDESLSQELAQTKREQANRDNVFDKRIAALIARDEALQARHEALAESVEMLVQSWFRKGGPEKQGS